MDDTMDLKIVRVKQFQQNFDQIKSWKYTLVKRKKRKSYIKIVMKKVLDLNHLA